MADGFFVICKKVRYWSNMTVVSTVAVRNILPEPLLWIILNFAGTCLLIHQAAMLCIKAICCDERYSITNFSCKIFLIFFLWVYFAARVKSGIRMRLPATQFRQSLSVGKIKVRISLVNGRWRKFHGYSDVSVICMEYIRSGCSTLRLQFMYQ